MELVFFLKILCIDLKVTDTQRETSSISLFTRQRATWVGNGFQAVPKPRAGPLHGRVNTCGCHPTHAGRTWAEGRAAREGPFQERVQFHNWALPVLQALTQVGALRGLHQEHPTDPQPGQGLCYQGRLSSKGKGASAFCRDYSGSHAT